MEERKERTKIIKNTSIFFIIEFILSVICTTLLIVKIANIDKNVFKTKRAMKMLHDTGNGANHDSAPQIPVTVRRIFCAVPTAAERLSPRSRQPSSIPHPPRAYFGIGNGRTSIFGIFRFFQYTIDA